MGTPSNLKDFFISYTAVDVERARWIAGCLEAAGYTTIYQERDFNAGINFLIEMNRAMQETRRTIAVLSPEYQKAPFALMEAAEAIRRDPTGAYALLVPVRVKPGRVAGIFGSIVYIDLVGLDDAAASARLLQKIGEIDRKPLPPKEPTLPPGAFPPPPPMPGAYIPDPGKPTIPLPPAPSPHKKPGWRGIVSALVGVVLLIALVLGLLLTHNPASKALSPTPTANHQATPTPTRTPTSSTPPVSFKLYTNQEFGFSVIYPNSWSIEAATNGSGKDFIGPANQKFQVTNLGSPPGVNVSGAVSDFCLGSCFYASSKQTSVTLVGLRWTREVCDNSIYAVHVLAEGVAYKGDIYLISYMAPTGTFNYNNTQYFTPMEQSFRFLT